MSIYSTRFRLASCKVSKELLREIEIFILKEAENYFTTGENAKGKDGFNALKKELYHVFIEGKDDSQKYSSIEEYSGDKLPDGTRAVVLDFSSIVDKFLHIKVTFHSSISEHPVLEIAMSDMRAKEVCKPIADGIISIVKQHRNFNSLFHNRIVQMGMLFLFAIYTFILYSMLCIIPVDEPFILVYNFIFIMALGLFVFWFIISIFMRRYTTFDSDRQKYINIGYYLFTIVWFLFIAAIVYNRVSKILH
jgi:hypothetical protein